MSEEWVQFRVLKIRQPIGEFYVGVVNWQDLTFICKADIRHWEEEPAGKEGFNKAEQNIGHYVGIQRALSIKRVREIQEYVQTVDACFPSTIIIGVSSEDIGAQGDESSLWIRKRHDAATVIDGQHRLAGFYQDTDVTFQLPVTIFIDLEIEEQAFLFSIINVKQTRINPSLAQDLLDFATIDTPEKVVHNIAKAMNSDLESPWYNQIKMLGKKDEVSSGIITQHSFVTRLIDLIYPRTSELQIRIRDVLKKNNDKRESLRRLAIDSMKYPLWTFYIENKEDAIKKILDNYFAAVKAVFPDQWLNDKSILSKTVGYGALMRQLRTLIPLGLQEKSLSEGFFEKYLRTARSNLGGRLITSQEFGGGESAVERLRDAMFPEQKTTEVPSLTS